MASLDEIQHLLQQIKDDLPALIQRSQVTPEQVVVVTGLSDVSERLGLVQAGEFRVGNSKEPNRGFSGVRIGYPPFLYSSELWHIVGVENDVLQVGIRASDGKLLAGGGAVILDEFGIFFANNQQSEFAFADTGGNRNTIIIYSGTTDDLTFANKTGVGGMIWFVDSPTHVVHTLQFMDDPSLTNRAYLRLLPSSKGARFNVGNEIFIYGEGGSGGYSAITMFPTATTPTAPSQSSETDFYIKGGKIIFQYDDAGTLRYKYLDLTGTGVTWVHTTTAP